MWRRVYNIINYHDYLPINFPSWGATRKLIVVPLLAR
ncbi:protein of unknown function [Pseudomonas sp. JV241A]|nr:protein of unknown function [Pseudomonas sp. JV241A]